MVGTRHVRKTTDARARAFSNRPFTMSDSMGKRLFVFYKKRTRKRNRIKRKGSRWKSAREKEKVEEFKLNSRDLRIPDVKV